MRLGDALLGEAAAASGVFVGRDTAQRKAGGSWSLHGPSRRTSGVDGLGAPGLPGSPRSRAAKACIRGRGCIHHVLLVLSYSGALIFLEMV